MAKLKIKQNNIYDIYNNSVNLNLLWNELIQQRLNAADNYDVGNVKVNGKYYYGAYISSAKDKMIVFRPRDLYIVGVAKLNKGEWEVNIQGNLNYKIPIKKQLNKVEFLKAMDNIEITDKKNQNAKNDEYMQIISFFTSEAARFQIVRDAANCILDNEPLPIYYDLNNEHSDNLYPANNLDTNVRNYVLYLDPIFKNWDKFINWVGQKKLLNNIEDGERGYIHVEHIREYYMD